MPIVPINDLDTDSCNLLGVADHISSIFDFTKNVPAPGIGRFYLSKSSTNENGRPDPIEQYVIPQTLLLSSHVRSRRVSRNNNSRRVGRMPPLIIGHFGGLGFLNALWYMTSQFGWSVDDESRPGEIIVDRRIMIAAQWLSNSLMFLPLLWTLYARWAQVISPLPLDHYLNGLVSQSTVII